MVFVGRSHLRRRGRRLGRVSHRPARRRPRRGPQGAAVHAGRSIRRRAGGRSPSNPNFVGVFRLARPAHTMTSRPRHRYAALFLALLATLWLAAPVHAQEAAVADPDTRPAFSLSTSEVFTTRDAPHFFLTFRRVPQLDFRVYKVRDPFAFFGGLDDPHQFGTDERRRSSRNARGSSGFADWKRGQRSTLRNFARAQASHEYRAARRAASDKAETAQRVALNANTFAQVPLLNADQVVTTWRELLPNHRDPELRRVPLDLKRTRRLRRRSRQRSAARLHDRDRVGRRPGDEDLARPDAVLRGESLHRRARRRLRRPRAVRSRRRSRKGRRTADGVFEGDAAPDERMEDVVGVAQCGDQIAATDPGIVDAGVSRRASWSATSTPTSRSTGPDTPSTPRRSCAGARWTRLRRSIGPTSESWSPDANDKVVFRQPVKLDAFGAVHATFPVPATARARQLRDPIQSGDAQAIGGVRGAGVSQAGVRGDRHARLALRRAGPRGRRHVQARYYFGQPVANGQLRLGRQPAAVLPRRCAGTTTSTAKRAAIGTATTRPQQGDVRLDADGKAQLRIPLASNRRTAATSAPASKRRSPTPPTARSPAAPSFTPPAARSCCRRKPVDSMFHRAAARPRCRVRAVDYLGAPQPSVPVTLDARASAISPAATTTSPRSRAIASAARPRPTPTAAPPPPFTLPPGQTGSFRVARDGDRAATASCQRSGVAVGAGPAATPPTTAAIGISSCWPTKELPAGRCRATLIVRGETRHRPGAGHQGRPARVVVSGCCGQPPTDAIEVPIDDGDVGDVFVNIAYLREGRLYRAERRLGVPAASTHAERDGHRATRRCRGRAIRASSRGGDRSRRRSRCARRSASR